MRHFSGEDLASPSRVRLVTGVRLDRDRRAGSALSWLPDLQPWHRLVSRLEPRASEFTERFTFDEYLRREEAVFREARDVVDSVVTRTANPAVPNRYVTGNRSHPLAFGDFNRTQVLDTADPTGGGC